MELSPVNSSEATGAISTTINFLQFTRFPDLPPELRLKIWKIASQALRTLELFYRHIGREIRCHQAPPALLHVCHESREVGLEVYHLSFGSEKRGNPPQIYFNPANDIIYFGARQHDDELLYINDYFRAQATELSIAERDHIQHVAIAEPLFSPHRSPLAFARNISRMHEALPCLKKLSFVKNHPIYLPGSSEVEERFLTYAGVSLIDSDMDLPREQYHILESLIIFFEVEGLIDEHSHFNTLSSIDITVMGYGYDHSQDPAFWNTKSS